MRRNLLSSLALPLMLALGVVQAAAADAPGRVGRLSPIAGEISMHATGRGDWERATPNWPVTTGDALRTGHDGRAEIRIGSSVLRLGAETSVEIVSLDDASVRVRLFEGDLAVRVRSADPAAAIAVEARHGIALPTGPGSFRIRDRFEALALSSYEGELNYRTDDRDLIVAAGQTATVLPGTRTEVRWEAAEWDDFARWVLARDERDDRIGRPRHVSPEMTGAEDLYAYGEWASSDEYGTVWYPQDVPSGWAPYRSGRWAWVNPWGWTWIDDAPWGFAPFHYGRWVLIGARWAWVPGRPVARPVYAPALVVWIGLPGVGATPASGALTHVGWFPLAPREIYIPGYRYSPRYVREINSEVTNVTEIIRVEREPRRARYVHRDRRDAVTLVPADVVRDSRPVLREARPLDERTWKLPRVATPIAPVDAPVAVEHRARRDRRPAQRIDDEARERLRGATNADGTGRDRQRPAVEAGRRPIDESSPPAPSRDRTDGRADRRDGGFGRGQPSAVPSGEPPGERAPRGLREEPARRDASGRARQPQYREPMPEPDRRRRSAPGASATRRDEVRRQQDPAASERRLLEPPRMARDAQQSAVERMREQERQHRGLAEEQRSLRERPRQNAGKRLEQRREDARMQQPQPHGERRHPGASPRGGADRASRPGSEAAHRRGRGADARAND